MLPPLDFFFSGIITPKHVTLDGDELQAGSTSQAQCSAHYQAEAMCSFRPQSSLTLACFVVCRVMFPYFIHRCVQMTSCNACSVEKKLLYPSQDYENYFLTNQTIRVQHPITACYEPCIGSSYVADGHQRPTSHVPPFVI